MSWISESLTAKVVSALSLMLLLLVGSAVAVYVQVQKQETDGLVINETGKLRMLSQRIAKSAFDLGREGISAQKRSAAREQLESTARQFGEGLQAVHEGDPSRSIPPAPPAVAGQLEVVDSLWTQTRADIDQVLEADLGSEAFREGLAGIQSRNLDLLREADRAVSLFQKRADSKITALYWVLSALLGLGALVFAGIVMAIRRLWISPVQRLDQAAQQVAAGDLEASVEVSSSDEVGQLAGSFNQMVGQIQEALEEARAQEQEAQEAKEEAARLAETSQEVSGFLRSEIEDLTERIERLGAGDLTVSFVGGGNGATSKQTDEAAQMTGQLRAKLQEAIQSVRQTLKNVASATEETASATGQISASSDQMAASAEEQSAQAEEVAAAVEELNQTINENAKSVQRTAEAAEAGGKQARRGGEVVAETTEKMEEVAAVVEETADAIEQLGASSEEIGQVVERIDEIAQQTNLLALNAAIEEVVASIGKVEQQTEEIAAASEQQSTTSEQIARSVQSISTAAQESAAGVTEVSDASKELEGTVGRLREGVEAFDIGAEEGLSQEAASKPASQKPGTEASRREPSAEVRWADREKRAAPASDPRRSAEPLEAGGWSDGVFLRAGRSGRSGPAHRRGAPAGGPGEKH